MPASSSSAIPHHLHAPSSVVQSTPTNSRPRPSPTGSPQQPSSPRSSPRSGSTGTIDIESVLRSSGGDIRKALEVVLSDRNTLQAQNTQLWKLIEKQRAQCSQLASDNDRLRQDREKANKRLTAAGLEPVANMKRITASASTVGLGLLKGEAPQIRRHNSDTEEAAGTPKTSSGNSSAPSSPAQQQAPTTLLPSPMADRRPRRDSKMTFATEVASFMTLADSPQDSTHPKSPMVPSLSYNTLSPASQYSASPSVNGREENGVIPPASSRALAATIGVAEPNKRDAEEWTAQPPPPRGSSMKSPPPDRSDTTSPNHSLLDDTTTSTLRDEQVRPSFESSSSRPSQGTATPRQSVEPYQEDERNSQPTFGSRPLPPLSPTLLPHARISIPSSTVFPNTTGRDVLCFIIEITVRPPNAQPVSWNVAKLFSAFLDLDTKIKGRAAKGRKEWKQMVAPLPEGRAWKDFAPSKIDQRKTALEAYLQSLLVAPISDKSDLCRFLSTDPVQAKSTAGRKEGYLTKKGKNFGGWKTRYFVLDGPVMEYYESRGGGHLGSITITNAQIGRQNRPSESTDERDFRHAFLIIEQAKKGSTNRHVLCAESDQERDKWIDILVRHVDPEPVVVAPTPTPAPASSGLMRKKSQVRKQSKDVVVTAAQPLSQVANNAKFAGAPSPSIINSLESQRTIQSSQSTSSHASNPSLSTQSSSAPLTPTHTAVQERRPSLTQAIKANSSTSSNGSHPITMVTSPSSDVLSSSPPATMEPTPRANKRQSMVPNRPSYTPAYLSSLSSQGLNAPPGYSAEKDRDRKAKSRGFWGFGKTQEKVSKPVFGVPLTDSIAIASVANLPAIVFRCIEYLEAKKAEEEEGVYRLSGSSAVIKGLKDRFDAEGDVNLLAVDELWDPHAIAGLLKTFLRDLPTSLLTRDLHAKFLAVMDLIDFSARVAELSRLVSELPPPNYALLRALTAHLILIVRNASLNKMTLRNIGIVFSPTLGIPAGIFAELVSHFGEIFDDDDGDAMVEQEAADPAMSVLDENVEETIKRKRNSMLYQAGGADAMLGLSGRTLDPAAEDSASEVSTDDYESEAHSTTSSTDPASNGPTSKAGDAPTLTSASAPSRRAKAAARGLAVEIAPLVPGQGTSDSISSKGSGKTSSNRSKLTQERESESEMATVL
ncbi:hypothetical protein IAR55_005464 [Kwoniella newhampshirensis]|uniref:RalA-binding protein 1 n=1 Tax=Kwoniella newhampshirensis TaxID=1651941 RepID=A0AAW0YHI2_9TREE